MNLATWEDYRKLFRRDDFPDDIPATPYNAYRGQWKGIPDWLGNGKIRHGDHWPYEEAKRWVRENQITSFNSLAALGKRRPKGLPSDPRKTYGEFFKSAGDFFGTGIVTTYQRSYRPFEEARAFTRSLGLPSGKEWRAYARSNRRPSDIPSTPARTYKAMGWKSMGDWLGTDYVAVQFRRKLYLSFSDAKAWVRMQGGLHSMEDWKSAVAEGRVPKDIIPSNPWRIYSEWRGMEDFLGSPKMARRYTRVDVGRKRALTVMSALLLCAW